MPHEFANGFLVRPYDSIVNARVDYLLESAFYSLERSSQPASEFHDEGVALLQDADTPPIERAIFPSGHQSVQRRPRDRVSLVCVHSEHLLDAVGMGRLYCVYAFVSLYP